MNQQTSKPTNDNRALLFNRIMTGVLVFSLLLSVAFLTAGLHRRNQTRATAAKAANASADAQQTQAAGEQQTDSPSGTDATNVSSSENATDDTVQPSDAATTEATEEEPPVGGNGKIIYLTFDDGPGQYTEQLLDILDKHDVKVTFFLTNFFTSYQYLIKREAESGHSVAVHSYKHDYDVIYQSEAAYWDDFQKMQDIIKEESGIETHLFRFPGGSSNTISKNKNPGIMTRLTQQATEKGLVYFDWNEESGDAGRTTDSAVVLANCKKGVARHDATVLLCHDTKVWTVNAMDEFITWALAEGYTFRPLTESSPTAHHPINN